jgi:hypothetical protein
LPLHNWKSFPTPSPATPHPRPRFLKPVPSFLETLHNFPVPAPAPPPRQSRPHFPTLPTASPPLPRRITRPAVETAPPSTPACLPRPPLLHNAHIYHSTEFRSITLTNFPALPLTPSTPSASKPGTNRRGHNSDDPQHQPRPATTATIRNNSSDPRPRRQSATTAATRDLLPQPSLLTRQQPLPPLKEPRRTHLLHHPPPTNSQASKQSNQRPPLPFLISLSHSGRTPVPQLN